VNEATTTTFQVSDVVPATTPLPEVPYKDAVEALIATSLVDETGADDLDDPFERYYRSTVLCRVEACSQYYGHLVSGVPFHAFVAAVHRAFMDHRPLCLSPDAIWLLICQGVAHHITVHAEELRNRFVEHEGKLQIEVRRDDFVKGSPENPWTEVVDDLCRMIRDHSGPECTLFEPSFTTTGPVERAVARMVFLDAMKSYFDYDVMTLCGIPAITLEGTADDWQMLADRVAQFGSLGLEWWIEPLRGILRQFVGAAQGSVDRPFWQSFYRYLDESGGPIITGWISTLFPYLKDEDTGAVTQRNPWLTVESQKVDCDDDEEDDDDDEFDVIEVINIEDFEEDFDDDDLDDVVAPDRAERTDRTGRAAAWVAPIPRRDRKEDYSEDRAEFERVGPRVSDLPSGLARVPFRWRYRKELVAMEFLGGFVGVSQESETLAVRPEIGWAVREQPGS
jgi:hypothetical protein